ncbi:hypothetical protein F66182_5220 [Fusarium sp. NRRL 66182]|nr:hypothetical protein F66182_5220 [Fusarium sp. NRRL 66182]
MHFSSLLPTLGGLVALAQASPHLLPGAGGLGGDLSLGKVVDEPLGGLGGDEPAVDGLGDKPVGEIGSKLGGVGDKLDGLGRKHSSIVPSTCSLANSWKNHILFKGIAAPATDSLSAISLGLNLPKAQVSGHVQLELVKDFLKEPRVRVGLGDIKAYIEVDISASAAVHESIELFASPALDLEIPGLLEGSAGAALALDLVIGVDAAIDLSAGVYLAFGQEAYVEISLLTKEIVDVSLEGLVTKALPIGVTADADLSSEVALQLGLRLRTEVDLAADLDIPVLEIEAGAKIAVWVSLFEYTAVLIGTDNCAISVSEVIALTLGLAVELDVEVGDILDISLAPTLTITLATAAKAKSCQPDRGSTGVFLERNGNTGSNTDTEVISLSTLPATGSVEDPTNPVGSVATTSSSPADPEATGPSGSYPVGDDATTSSSPAGPETTPTDYPVDTVTSSSGKDTVTGDVTSTVTSTHVYTVTSCAASVINCPARYTQKVITSTIVQSTYVCPATESGAVPATTTAHASSAPEPVITVTDTLTTIVPCETPTTSTFQPPTTAPPAPTVTIVDTTTYCPSSEKPVKSTAAPSEVTSGFQIVTTSVPSTEEYEVPSASTAKVPEVSSSPAVASTAKVPEAPSSDTPNTEAQQTPSYAVPTARVPQAPTSVVSIPEEPTADKPVLPPVQSVPYPHGNGTVSTSVPGVAITTGSYVPPVVSTPIPHPIISTPAVVPEVPTPVATPVGSAPSSPPVSVSGGSVVRSGLLMAVPAAVALFM